MVIFRNALQNQHGLLRTKRHSMQLLLSFNFLVYHTHTISRHVLSVGNAMRAYAPPTPPPIPKAARNRTTEVPLFSQPLRHGNAYEQ
jgi:hypothetical protein